MQRKLESYGRLPPTLNTKGQCHPLTCLFIDRGVAEVQLQPIRSFGARRGGVHSTALRLLLHREGPRLGESRGWTGWARKVSSPPDRPARSESLYRLHFYGRHIKCFFLIFQLHQFSNAYSRRTNQDTRKTDCVLELYCTVRLRFTNPSSEYPHQDGVLGRLSLVSRFSSSTWSQCSVTSAVPQHVV
jgi:hypothetical protein